MANGNQLRWEAPAEAPAEVEVQRLVGEEWVTVATVPAAAGEYLDAAATESGTYRIAWSSQVAVPAGPDLLEAPLATLAPDLPREGQGGMLLTALMWGLIAVFATVRAPDVSVRTRSFKDQALLSVFADLPGVDQASLQRAHALGLRTAGQMMSLDAEALAFWSGIPASTFRQWQDTLDILQWPMLPAGAAQRLAGTGTGSLERMAASDPVLLYHELRSGAPPGPASGLPDSPDQVEVWVLEARKALQLRGAALNGPLPGRASV